ncbi:MAG: MazG family protein [Sporichthyaceae bacterium]
MTGRLVLLPTSPRVAPGLLAATAWDVLRSGAAVLAAPGHPLTPYAGAEGVSVREPSTDEPRALARELLGLAGEGTVVWLVGADGDPALGLALGELLESGAAATVELEVLPGSYDLPGARLLDLVAVMDRLRSPGGCPWDAEQTHASLATYLVEETYETLEAIDTGDRAHLREELGDLLLQVVFHARVAAEDPDDPWSVDDVAGGIVDKLVRRHPHVFGAATAETAADVEAGWERQKATEKGRTSAVDGVPMALPALSLAIKLVHRAEKNGVHVPPVDGDGVGDRLMALAVEARANGLDPEAELRAAARRFADRVRAAEVPASGKYLPGTAPRA